MALNPDDTLLNGQYRILRLLGRGGFGFVYHAQDTHLGEQVAIKELIPGLIGDEAMLKRFLAEARATMRLTHKHIVRTYHVFPEGTNYYIVMEYMPGGSLEDRLRQHGPLAVEDAVQMAAEVCEGLACAHEEQVVHCDLKPANILFDAAGRAKIADFGIAHVSGEMLTRSWMTPAGFVAGTLPYMSPEQTDGVRDDPRLDIYALGAVLYRALTGRTYLDFDQQETPRAQAENVGRIYSQEAQPPSQHNRKVPAWLDAIVLTTLAKRPEDRYQSARGLRQALWQQKAPQAVPTPAAPSRELVQPRPVSARPAPRETPRPARRASLPRWFWPAAAAAIALFVVLAITFRTLVVTNDEATPAPTQPVVAQRSDTRTPIVEPLTVTPQPSDRPELPTATNTIHPAATATLAPTVSNTPAPTATATSVPTASNTPVPTASNTPVPTASNTPAPAINYALRGEIILPDGIVRAVEEKGGFAYVLERDGTLFTYDVSGLRNQPSFTTYQSPLSSLPLGNSRGLLRNGDYLYAFGREGMEIIDIQNASSPTIVRSNDDLSVNNLIRHNNYLVAVGLTGLAVYDATNPANPSLQGRLDVGTDVWIYSAAIYKQTLYTSEFTFIGGESSKRGLRIYDFGNPSSPKAIRFLEQGYTAYHLEIVGDQLIECTTENVRSWSLETPRTPVFRASKPAAARVCALYQGDIVVNNKVFRLNGDQLETVFTFEPGSSQVDGFPYGSAVASPLIFLAQSGRVLVLSGSK